MKQLMKCCSAVLLMLLLCYCGTARRGEPIFAPVPLADQAIANGEIVYMNYCQKCHPGGEAGLGPAINNKPLPGFMIKLQVRKGLGMMPAFKEEVIPNEELDNMVTYLKTLRKAKEVAQ